MIQVQVHEAALKRGLDVDEVIRMWVDGTDETLIDDKGRPWEMGALSFGNGPGTS